MTIPSLKTCFQAAVGSVYLVMGLAPHPATELAGAVYDHAKLRTRVALGI